MEVIRADSLVRDQILQGKDGEAVVRSVQSRLGQLKKQGITVDWNGFKPPNPFWFEGFSRGRNGRKLGRRAAQAAMTRYMIEYLIESVGRELKETAWLPEAFAESEPPSEGQEEVGNGRPSRNVNTKGERGILYATNPQEILTYDPNLLFRQLTPIIWKLAGQAMRAWDLEWVERDDLVQVAREQIWKHLDKYDGKGWFKSWAATVARNARIDHARREKRSNAPLPDEYMHEPTDIDLHLDLYTALRKADEGRLITLSYLVGLSEREIAVIEGYTPMSRAISMRLSRGKDDMLALLA